MKMFLTDRISEAFEDFREAVEKRIDAETRVEAFPVDTGIEYEHLKEQASYIKKIEKAHREHIFLLLEQIREAVSLVGDGEKVMTDV
jgi:uncharacterized LabA/DUF88 family protein